MTETTELWQLAPTELAPTDDPTTRFLVEIEKVGGTTVRVTPAELVGEITATLAGLGAHRVGLTADLGDARCTVDLTSAAYHGSGTVAALSAVSAFTASGLGAFDDGWFTAGKLTFTGGGNAGLAMEVKNHGNSAGAVSFTLWQVMAQPIQGGDTFTVTAGCDKRFATCNVRFNNAVNFRGFPHIPGNDFVISYPVQGQPGNDGSSRVGGG